jgi:aspartyl-tRNA(Asn)/glutamyl-tRNA(Gln) amidotransferase subunit C
MASKKTLTTDDIKHLGTLANLTLNDTEIAKYQKQFVETLEYVANLDTLDTSKVKETSSTANLENVTFADGTKCTRQLTPEEATRNAKYKKKGMFVVKRIM